MPRSRAGFRRNDQLRHSHGHPRREVCGLFRGVGHHISVYPVPAGNDAFQAEIAPFRSAKGTLKFPFGKPVPYGLIERTAALLAAERERQ